MFPSTVNANSWWGGGESDYSTKMLNYICVLRWISVSVTACSLRWEGRCSSVEGRGGRGGEGSQGLYSREHHTTLQIHLELQYNSYNDNATYYYYSSYIVYKVLVSPDDHWKPDGLAWLYQFVAIFDWSSLVWPEPAQPGGVGLSRAAHFGTLPTLPTH